MNKNFGEKADILSASTIVGIKVENIEGENIGSIEDIMIDLDSGHIAYVVLSFGGILGIGDKLFAVPWGAFSVDTVDEKFVLDIDKERLENAEGFDKDNWPDMEDLEWRSRIYDYYNTPPYW